MNNQSQKDYAYRGPANPLLENFMKDTPSTAHMFYRTVNVFGDRPAQKFKVDGEYQILTYRDFADIAEEFGNGFISLGLQKGERMCIMAPTSPRWDWADYGGRNAGCVVGTIYPAASDQETVTIANDSEISCICVGDEALLDKMLRLWDKIATLKHIVILNSTYQSNRPHVMNMDQLREQGRSFGRENPDALKQRWTSLAHDDPASILYTSGTTGNLKGCVLTHKNILAATLAVSEVGFKGNTPFSYEDVVFSILPLAHNWNRFDNHSACISYGGLIGYAEGPKTLLQDLAAIQPTFLMLVARLWDRIFNGVSAAICSTPEGKQKFSWAMDVGRRVFETRMDENGVIDLTADPTANLDTQLKEDFLKADGIFSIFRGAFGGRVNKAYSGGSLLPADLQRNYWSMNFPLLDGWGLTETTSGINMIQARCVRIGWLCPEFAGPNAEAKLDEDGEILVRGDAVITEYLKKPEDTAASFTGDGWFRTGDLGEFDHGYLRIVDRKKNIIVLDTGKNVSPAYIELKFTNSPIIEQILVLGDNRKYITALVVPAFDAALNIFKEQEIQVDESKLVHAEINSIMTCIEVGEDLIRHSLIADLIEREIAMVNQELSAFEAIKKYKIIPRKFTEEGGELTPTLKVKNRVVFARYAEEIEELYR
ncbi:MAG: AMP-dependent synthetase/ligase [Ignavibacteriales bacterium]